MILLHVVNIIESMSAGKFFSMYEVCVCVCVCVCVHKSKIFHI